MAKRSQAWKDLEKLAAKKLGGIRHRRGADFGQSAPDVTVPGYLNHKQLDNPLTFKVSLIVECKYSKDQPWVRMVYDRVAELPTYNPFIGVSQDLYIWNLNNTEDVLPMLHNPSILAPQGPLSMFLDRFEFFNIRKKTPGYIEQALNQADMYGPWSQDQFFIPVMCLGMKNKHLKVCLAKKSAVHHGVKVERQVS